MVDFEKRIINNEDCNIIGGKKREYFFISVIFKSNNIAFIKLEATCVLINGLKI